MSADRSVWLSLAAASVLALSFGYAQERPAAGNPPERTAAAAAPDKAANANAPERPATPFSRTILVGRAEELAKQPYVEPTQPASDNSPNKLTYDQYRAIRFEKGASIWA